MAAEQMESLGGSGRAAEAVGARRIVVAVIVVGLLLALPGRWLAVAGRVGVGFAAKVACSLHFNSDLDAQQVFDQYIASEVAPLGPFLRLRADVRGVEAWVPGWVRARAEYRPGLGCTLLTGGAADEMARPSRPLRPLARLDAHLLWPVGEARSAAAPAAVEAALERAFSEPEGNEAGRLRATTAIVVAHRGRLIAERYAPGYDIDTRMLSWSMAKSVLATLIAAAIADGRFALAAPVPVPEWQTTGDRRSAITLDQMLRMSSGLAFDEHYGAVNDVSRMLFTMPDVGAFAAASPLAQAPDEQWSYSSGTSNILARMLRDSFGGDIDAMLAWMRVRFFEPAGLRSALVELDPSGTPIGSSFFYMTARDWARFGELHRLDGIWRGRRLLPEGWVKYVTTPTPLAPEGSYGAHWWLNAGDPQHPEKRAWPSVPTDAYAAQGHSGQYVVVIPSAELVVVRLGLSVPDDGDDGTEELLAELIRLLASE